MSRHERKVTQQDIDRALGVISHVVGSAQSSDEVEAFGVVMARMREVQPDYPNGGWNIFKRRKHEMLEKARVREEAMTLRPGIETVSTLYNWQIAYPDESITQFTPEDNRIKLPFGSRKKTEEGNLFSPEHNFLMVSSNYGEISRTGGYCTFINFNAERSQVDAKTLISVSLWDRDEKSKANILEEKQRWLLPGTEDGGAVTSYIRMYCQGDREMYLKLRIPLQTVNPYIEVARVKPITSASPDLL